MLVLDDVYESVNEASSLTELLTLLVRFGNQFGFDRVAAWTTIRRSVPGYWGAYRAIHNYPRSWPGECMRHRHVDRDPATRHLLLSNVPLIWDKQFYVLHGCADLWDTYKGFGFDSGVVLGMKDRHGSGYKIDFSSECPLPTNVSVRSAIVGELQLFATIVQSGMQRLMTPDSRLDPLRVTARQREILAWTADGKTAWEIGQLLDVSPRTVEFHLQTVIRTLGCSNKLAAVVEAMRRGLIY